MEITINQIKDIISPTTYDDAKFKTITDSLNQTFAKYSIDSYLRICHFLAQVLHESAAFRYTAELWGPTPQQQTYDTRSDLGNTTPGDGFKYRGRGWIQLTGKANYTMAGKAFNQDFVNDPDLVKVYPWAAMVSGWYWDNHQLNGDADKDDIMTITKIVNGGYNGIDDRKVWFAKAKKFLIVQPTSTNLRTGKVTATKLNIRVSPSINAGTVTDPLVQNTPITITDEQGEWIKVEVTGWVKKEFVQIN